MNDASDSGIGPDAVGASHNIAQLGLGSLGRRSTKKSRAVLSALGSNYRGHAHTRLMRDARTAMVKQRQAEQLKSVTKSLKRGWDSMVVRRGDTAFVDETDCQVVAAAADATDTDTSMARTNCNTYTDEGFLSVAWGSLSGTQQQYRSHTRDANGKRRRVGLGTDIRGSTRGLEASTTLAAMAVLEQDEQIDKIFDDIRQNAVAVRFQRASDSTPWNLFFGEMCEQLRTVARYFTREEVRLVDGTLTERFVTCSYEEYVAKHPRRRNTMYGVVEICASWGTLTYIDTNGVSHKRQVRRAPLVLERTNSSTLFSMYDAFKKKPSASARLFCGS